MLSRAKASKETTYCVLTEFRETDIFLRPLERLSEVKNPTLRAAHTRGGVTLKVIDLPNVRPQNLLNLCN